MMHLGGLSMKYYLAVLTSMIGEYEIDTSIKFFTDRDPNKYHHKLAKSFWGKCREEEDEVYYFDGVSVTVGDRIEITKEVFDSIPNSIACTLRAEWEG
jgi:hypothetical protein